MENKVKVLRTLSGEVSMPTKLLIGDPFYFNDYKHLVYDKTFRGKKNWKGFITLTEEEHSSDEYDFTCKIVYYEIIFAKDDELLHFTKKGFKRCMANDNVVDINLDSASYVLQTNKGSETIITASDGYCGHVINSYLNEKLELIIIKLSVGDNSFEYAKEVLERVFDCNLK